MKMRLLVVATTAALVSFGAVAGGGQQQSQRRENTEASIVREAQDKLRAQGYAATPQSLKEFAALGVGASASSGASSEQAPQPGERPKY